jgi:hypothetical protein
MILLNKLNQHDIRRSWIISDAHVATTTLDDRLRAYGVNFKTAGEIVNCSMAFPGFPSTRTFAQEAMYGSKGWKTKWSNDHSDSHYPIILGGYQLPNTTDKPRTGLMRGLESRRAMSPQVRRISKMPAARARRYLPAA